MEKKHYQLGIISDARQRERNRVAKESLRFVRNQFLTGPDLKSSLFLYACQVQERLEDPPVPVEPVCSSVCDIVDEVCHAFRASRDSHAKELVNLLSNAHLKALLETHDAVVERREASSEPPDPPALTMPTNKKEEIPIRVVGLRRQPDEPLVSPDGRQCIGITLRQIKENCVII